MGRLGATTCSEQFAQANPTLEESLKKLVLVASGAIALACSVSLLATSVDAKTRHKRPAATSGPMIAGDMGGPRHDLGGPMKSGNQCWKDRDPWAYTGQGYWGKC